MNEYLTDALVLAKEDSGELDSTVFLYTRDLGKIRAKAKSGRKITSKMGGHLEPLNFVKVRLVEKNGFQIADALTISRPLIGQPPLVIVKFLSFLRFIKEMTFEEQTDYPLWSAIKKTLTNPGTDEKTLYRSFLKVLGFNPEFAECVKCGRKKVEIFMPEEQVFLCRKCGLSRHSSVIAKPNRFIDSDMVEI